jgi:starch phosphorylase
MSQLLEITSIVPFPIARLTELAANLFFSWHRPTRALFQDLDPELWPQVNGNPRLMLRCVDQSRLDQVARDPEYLARYAQVCVDFDAYLSASPPNPDDPLVAYFCAEYGMHESFPIYSGGLGVLAGDHCKAASDERLNFVAVGLLYRQGYFVQKVDSDGVQLAQYADTDPRDLPVEPVLTPDGAWLRVAVRIGNSDVYARLWRAQVGRVPVFLLDTNCEENSEPDRDITHRLYGGDEGARIRQEIVLGIGGVRALRALGLAPGVFHINEGHAAFLTIELLREGVARGLEFPAALEAVAAQCVFTTHTPVAAGHDVFHDGLFAACLGEFALQIGVPLEKLAQLGRTPGASGGFNMTRLALNGARRVNGVSRVHGKVTAQLVADHWREVAPAENPVGYITNGVHVPTFLAQPWCRFFDQQLGLEWRERLSDEAFWRRLEQIPDEIWWATAQNAKSRMIAGVRQRLEREYVRRGGGSAQLRHVTRLLDPSRPHVLTLGFARRFATYKRAALLLHNRARLARLIDGSERPVMFLFAGKAHPADGPGQAVLREIKQLMLSPEFSGNVVFLEDYDMQLARWLVSGVDVWLNNPVAPLEASGTSGIKAAINGRLNLSILDGWWAEGFDGTNGWGVPPSSVQDGDRRDALDADSILDTLEEEVVPLYYADGGASCPTAWVRRCKRAQMTVIPRFNTRRMVSDYAAGVYRPAAAEYARLMADGAAPLRSLTEWQGRVFTAWGGVTLRRLQDAPREVARGRRLRIRVAVGLNGLRPEDVAVEFFGQRRLPRPQRAAPLLASFRPRGDEGRWTETLQATGEHAADGAVIYALDIEPQASGQFLTEIRIRPQHPMLSHPLQLGLLKRA